MKLGGVHIVLPDRRRKRFAVAGARRHDRCIDRFRKETMNEINVAAARYPFEEGTIRASDFELVPTDLRHFQSIVPSEADHLALEDPKPRGAAIKLFALFK